MSALWRGRAQSLRDSRGVFCMSGVVPALAAACVMSGVGCGSASADERAIDSIKINFGSQPWTRYDEYKKQEISYSTNEHPGTVIIDSRSKFLYFIEGNGKALRYGIGVGREGFKWSGTERIARKAEWPDWHPPVEMRKRDWTVPEFVAGGKDNPLGARALYLGNTLYRIHGTNQPWTIGWSVSSGCIRLTNDNIIDLYNRVKIGTTVVVK